MVFEGHFLSSKVLFIEIFVNIFQSQKYRRNGHLVG